MTTESFSHIHSRYCELTNRDMPCTMSMHFQWQAWTQQGWTESDLALVVRHIQSLIKLDRRRPESLRFHNLIGNTERFNEDLAEARALNRNPKTTARDNILSATGRASATQQTARTPAEIMAGNLAFTDWKLWRQQTGL